MGEREQPTCPFALFGEDLEGDGQLVVGGRTVLASERSLVSVDPFDDLGLAVRLPPSRDGRPHFRALGADSPQLEVEAPDGGASAERHVHRSLQADVSHRGAQAVVSRMIRMTATTTYPPSVHTKARERFARGKTKGSVTLRISPVTSARNVPKISP